MAVPAEILTTVGENGDTGGITIHKKKRRRVVIRRASRKGGVVRYFEEADKLLGEIAKTMAGKLRDGALKDDRADLKRLVDAAMRKGPRAEPVKKTRAGLVKKRGITSAQEVGKDLRLHGEWVKEVEEEQGIGIRE